MKQALNNSICNLKSLLEKSFTAYANKSSEKLEISETPKEEDVIIIHDSLFKDISEGFLKNEKLTVKKVWAAGVRDAHE